MTWTTPCRAMADRQWGWGGGGSNPLAPTNMNKGLGDKPKPFLCLEQSRYQNRHQSERLKQERPHYADSSGFADASRRTSGCQRNVEDRGDEPDREHAATDISAHANISARCAGIGQHRLMYTNNKHNLLPFATLFALSVAVTAGTFTKYL